jgi:hypothetical protein
MMLTNEKRQRLRTRRLDLASHLHNCTIQKVIRCRLVVPQMKNKLIVSQSILWATALLVVALVDDTQYTLFLLALLATVAVVNLNKHS